jgi:hypothetical protein
MKTAIIGSVLLFVASSCGKSPEEKCKIMTEKVLLCMGVPGYMEQQARERGLQGCLKGYQAQPEATERQFEMVPAMSCQDIRIAAGL